MLHDTASMLICHICDRCLYGVYCDCLGENAYDDKGIVLYNKRLQYDVMNIRY